LARTAPERSPGRGVPAPRVAILAAVVALVVAAVAGFAVTRGRTPSQRPTDCPGSRARCIPTLQGSAVIAALKSKGHDCTSENRGDGVRWECKLQIGATEYSLHMNTRHGQVNTVLADVRVLADRPAQGGGNQGAASGTVPYLLWFASLPFSDDPLTVADVKAWLTRQVEAGKRATVRIAGYRYIVDASKEGAATFDMEGMIG
jgi:hypothetical protein